MSINADTLRRLAALRLDPEAMAEVLSIIADVQTSDDGAVKMRAAGARRQAAYRDRKASQTVTSDVTRNVTERNEVTQGFAPPPSDGFPIITNNPSLPTPAPFPNPSSASADRAVSVEFENEFWPIYPNKVGKPVALKSWIKARRMTNRETIINGLRAYVAKTDDRPWCNPATWLNQERWADAPASGRPDPTARGSPAWAAKNPNSSLLLEMMEQKRNAEARTYDQGQLEYRS